MRTNTMKSIQSSAFIEAMALPSSLHALSEATAWLTNEPFFGGSGGLRRNPL